MPAVVLLAWPMIALVIFGILGPARGLIWVLLVGFLYLPEDYGFDLPAVVYDKYTALALSLMLGVLVTRGRDPEVPATVDRGFGRLVTGLLIALFVAIAITMYDNTVPLNRGGRFQAGHGLRDLVNFLANTILALVPFLLARRWLSDPKFHTEFLRAIVIMALIYSLFILFERRMSPQLNRWLYGLVSDAWIQHIRGGGFRPMVFLSHGLVIGYFLLSATLASVALARGATDQKWRVLYGLAAVWLFLVLALSRNLGALLLAMVFVPALLFLTRRGLLWMAMSVGLVFMAYPAVRQLQLVPTNAFVLAIEAISPSRAKSFAFRLENEDGLLARAFEKPFFGWGGWGRSRVIDERGRDLSVTDGVWIIRLGQFGWVGYICYFGLVTAPVIFLRRRRSEVPAETLGLATIVSANLVYLIPNATLGPVAWTFSGALAGYLQYGQADEGAKSEVPASREMTYSRFPAPTDKSAYRRHFKGDA